MPPFKYVVKAELVFTVLLPRNTKDDALGLIKGLLHTALSEGHMPEAFLGLVTYEGWTNMQNESIIDLKHTQKIANMERETNE